MACIRKRRGKWVVDYRDATGRRRWVTCETKRDAEVVLSEKLRESRQVSVPAVNPTITVAAYSERWLEMIRSSVTRATLEGYRLNLSSHVLPALGAMKVQQLTRGRIKSFLAEKLNQGLARNTVRLIHAPLRGMLSAALDDGIIVSNPAAKLGRQLRITSSPSDREEVKAMSRDELSRFLGAAKEKEPRWFPLFFTAARTGLRLGELRALRSSLNFPVKSLHGSQSSGLGC